MKRFKFSTIMMILAIFLFGGIPFTTAHADTILPNTVTTHKDDRVIYNFIDYKTISGGKDDYRLYAKKDSNGNYMYCIDLKKHYDGGVKYTKTGKMDPGIVYILNHKKSNHGYEGLDYYTTQMAVYWYEDWLVNDNHNLAEPFKKYIKTAATIKNADVSAMARLASTDIYNLWLDAVHYRETYTEKNGYINVLTNVVTFTEQDGYFVSSKIYIKSGNLNGDMKKTISNKIDGMKILRDDQDGGYVIKVPVSSIPEGKKATFTLTWSGSYITQDAYYYYANNEHQRLLYDKLEEKSHDVKASIQLTVKNFTEKYNVDISKTDVTQTKEIPGATLVLKDAAGNKIEEWVSTSTAHRFSLNSGEYSLTETIAPEGYKLSTTTIYFMLDENGKLFEKVNGQYVQVDKINMINELKDMIAIAKKDKNTGAYLAGATLVIKDANGNVVKEFVSDGSVYQLTLNAGEYTLVEKAAPSGYILSNEVVSFRVLENGNLQVKNSNGVYEDSVMVVYYNSPEKKEDVPVPSTGKSGMIITIAGITLLIAGVVYAIKTTKEC